MLRPDFKRGFGNRIYRCLIAGYLFTFFVGSARLERNLAALALSETVWPILKADVTEIPFLREAFLGLAKANQIRRKL